MSNILRVGMADYKIAKAPDGLITLGLGSCVGAVIFDASKGIAGMAHVMLPSSLEIKNNANKLKFADTCIDLMMEDLIKAGVSKSSLKAKIAGGAQMFSVSLKTDNLNIGTKNVEAVKAKLKSLNIPIVSEDTLGNSGRTITFDIPSLQLHIKSIGKGESII
ncbi:chemotaxis protein CheD [Criibacterium bergeronii]|mgnify:CR=1 FL=1|uniref:Probable chemoreceptor glutamine deamidase CheD n=1 Tax=Criibacterium bergeronii TaxID=1871336 RepID=A0A371IMI4_9FIRM|nr:chemotaxis protein CheD [Criibacterium bergeronii]MBS6062367.1 chemotaxis protein CheD [Peptostreptococcaceae bacterium]RDY21715.1 chemotaxis protein CheD [Criibacterium bergeronii]